MGIALSPSGRQRASVSHGGPITGRGVVSAANVLPFPARAGTTEVGAEVDAANAELAAGIQPQSWFDELPPGEQAACIEVALAHVPHLASGESDNKGGKVRNSYTLWRECIAAAKNSGVRGAEDIARRWSEADPYSRHTDAAFDQAWDSSDGSIGAGTLFSIAQDCGWESAPWKAKADAARGAQIVQAMRATLASGGPLGPIKPGEYDEKTALALMNARYAQVLFRDGKTKDLAYVECDGKGASVIVKEDIAEMLSNCFVRVQQGNAQKPVPIFPWWRAHTGRGIARNEIFDPDKPPGVNGAPGEFNFWQGFAVQPLEGGTRSSGCSITYGGSSANRTAKNSKT